MQRGTKIIAKAQAFFHDAVLRSMFSTAWRASR